MDVSFDRTWADYKMGFGNKDDGGDFWLGLENIHHIVTQAFSKYILWIVIIDTRKIPHIFPYDGFTIDDEDAFYEATYTKHLGTSINYFYSGHPFVTKDKRPIRPTSSYKSYYDHNCASFINSRYIMGGGGWWFSGTGNGCCSPRYGCGHVNLNAKIPSWLNIYNISSIVMKLRPDTI